MHWTEIGVATVAMTGPVMVGLFDTAHNIGEVSTAAFDNVQVTRRPPPPPPGPLPSPWIDTDVGSPRLAGLGRLDTGGVFTVNGAGTDIWGTSDQFNYVYQPLAGDGNGTIIARVTSQSNTSSNAKAGVMIKQSTTAGSDYVLIAASHRAATVKVQYDFNGRSGQLHLHVPERVDEAGQPGKQVHRLPVQRRQSPGPACCPKTLPITFPATIGLFECSQRVALGTATFDNVSYTGGT